MDNLHHATCGTRNNLDLTCLHRPRGARVQANSRYVTTVVEQDVPSCILWCIREPASCFGVVANVLVYTISSSSSSALARATSPARRRSPSPVSPWEGRGESISEDLKPELYWIVLRHYNNDASKMSDEEKVDSNYRGPVLSPSMPSPPLLTSAQQKRRRYKQRESPPPPLAFTTDSKRRRQRWQSAA